MLSLDQQRKLQQAESTSVTGDMTDGAARSCCMLHGPSDNSTATATVGRRPALPSSRKTENVTSSHCWGSGNLDRCQSLLRSAPGSIPGQCRFLSSSRPCRITNYRFGLFFNVLSVTWSKWADIQVMECGHNGNLESKNTEKQRSTVRNASSKSG